MRPNTIEWKSGDIVIHARDAKEHRMLRKVKAVRGDQVYTEWAFPEELQFAWANRKLWPCPMKDLHDPKRYGISKRKAA